ncbi:HD domain-containing protein [Gillisia sp. Hel_I_29]|uniref:HD domain-containing protein n=1 Tax=Gillisia sp. Hel_I_29 TaxID=1249975 RepID=UPI00054D9EC9|nr:HD domain-containing protein [Gillisia sp. Hel_I_29]
MNNLFYQISQSVMLRLENELPKYLTYHAPYHTKYVMDRAVFIAKEENIEEEDLFLLKVAALYHDTGFTVNREDHEAISCKIANEELPTFGIHKDQIEIICGLIRATKIPQSPKNKLEKVLADADLEYLGTDKFQEFGDKLYHELLHYEPKLDLQKWNEIQYDFVKNHKYHTAYGRKYLEPKKQENLRILLDKMHQL